MGLDTSHNCWHGPYSAFMQWRQEIARAAGLPPLKLMEGFYLFRSPIHDPLWEAVQQGPESTLAVNYSMLAESLPIKWECLKPSPLHFLLQHSDYDGEIPWELCGPIADELEKLLPKIPSTGQPWDTRRQETEQFISGLRAAADAGEAVDFH